MGIEHPDRAEELTDPFSISRAEQLSDRIFSLFKKPSYFPALETVKPCVLVGGRGTGKTTVLRCLSYQGRFELDGHTPDKIDSWAYVGLYYRVNTNRVASFRGDELTASQWQRLFAHYINLVLCGQILDFLHWYNIQFPDRLLLSEAACQDIATVLCIPTAASTARLNESLRQGRREFESYLNNIDPNALPPLSLQGQPIDELVARVREIPSLSNKIFFFLLDEFENFFDDQQVVVNTLIKHAEASYTFKVGVRELGWRSRSTLNPSEQLIHPADFQLIDIGQSLSGKTFEQFAREVCNERGKAFGVDVTTLLPSLTKEQEAMRLGLADRVQELLDRTHDEDAQTELKRMRPLEAYFAGFWADAKRISLRSVLNDRRQFPSEWNTRFNNYSYSILFTIRHGKVGIRKFYAGWQTYVLLADGNIRYLLELVAQARALQRREGKPEDLPIDPAVQTRAAELVGQNCLSELEGVLRGAELTRLVLGLGRIFEVMAREPGAHTPDVNEFRFADEADLTPIEGVLTAAIMHLALSRRVSSKRSNLELKAYDYSLHPIFAAFFAFSHAKKRKMLLSPDEILTLIKSPREAIAKVLERQNRDVKSPLPEQLQLFEGFYGTPS
jgi:hypothetical protein